MKKIAIHKIFTLCFTSPIPAIKLKFICNKKLKTKNKIEYCKITQESQYLAQNRTDAICGQNTNINLLKIIQIITKIFEKLCFIIFNFLFSHFELNSEKIGIKIIKIGHKTKKGIFIILK